MEGQMLQLALGSLSGRVLELRGSPTVNSRESELQSA